MPYIESQYREELNKEIDALAISVYKIFLREQEKAKKEGRERFQTRDGLLNYAFTRILNQTYPEPNYHEINEKIGLLECAKLESYREQAAPYEDLKKNQNGDVVTYTKAEMQKKLKDSEK